ncbi:Stk1 family PASTA domain-containing Ser/Thr kinase [Nakamurella sp. PAMC28650]|uniref:Stk1 family PASTA domain-containing Ser/Thr kinase n=1 Tax=Nakamurella sp. PAMC28650 TaxID=2762325 RepID=UPI00164E3FA1|nr:Stk1 family PASTA domain-containing Ser/Thr kinase [Nakamurella sp. PAMC28650]QNK82052.1 Stk1 family PASTA domain-containing Ser/Thr kinase [Nakamurella sp. PAMC28650]
MTGHLFGDRYQVGDTLGFGGMSEVHRGRDLRLGRDVAIKVLRADLARDPSFQTRFRREAQNAASLNHPAIVAVYDTGETQGEASTIPYIVMEYVDGETLRDLLKREGSLAPKRAMEIVADVCAALDFSHRHGIVHRDIKPANVMLTRAGAVKVMDFGIARAVADGQATMTATAAVIGTAQYLSPEQARGEAVDARSDVYATGCVLFELLVGAPPFTGDSPVAVAYQHVREEPKAPSEVKPGLPKELDSIVLKALNKNPLNRYQTAAEMRSDLVRALSGQAVHATPVMSDEERTTLMRATPERVGLAVMPGPSLLAPPRRPMADDIWEDEEPDRAKKVWGYVGIGVLCLALLAGAIFLTMKLTRSSTAIPQVPVPQVQGQTRAAAEKAITGVGLILGVESPLASDTVPSGSVVSQNPSGGTPIDKGKSVSLVISTGISQVTVPNLNGMNVTDAKAQLNKLGLQMGTPTKQLSSDAQKDTVISQKPPTNTSAKPGSTVDVVVGSGPSYQTVPSDLVGKSYDQAAAELGKLGLKASKTSIDGTAPKDQVLSFTGALAGGRVQTGTTLVINVSNNALFVMPPLSNLPLQAAVAQLNALGWKGDVNTINQRTSPTKDITLVGLIASGTAGVPGANQQPTQVPAQTPAANLTVNKTVGVTLVVYEKQSIPVPSFTPDVTTQAEIQNQLTAAGFTNYTLNIINPAQPPHVPHTFASLSGVNAGDPVPFDTAFTITINGDPPKPTPTPTPTPTTAATSPSSSTAAPTTPTSPTRRTP